MKLKQVKVTVTKSQIKDYNMLDIVVETDIGVRERHEIIPDHDLRSTFDFLMENIREEFLQIEWEMMENL